MGTTAAAAQQRMPQQLTTTPHHGSLQPQLLATQLRENTDNTVQ